MRRLIVTACLLLMSALPATAQTVYNPKLIEFDSPDHLTDCSGVPCVSAYVVEYWLQGVDQTTGQPVSSGTLPKASITGTAPTYTSLLSSITPILGIPVGVTYVARVRAVGITPDLLSDRSAASNPFASASVPRPPLAVSVR